MCITIYNLINITTHATSKKAHDLMNSTKYMSLMDGVVRTTCMLCLIFVVQSILYQENVVLKHTGKGTG